jgi:peptidoglycan/xylan/chitin deacetylase (PgdA/CDA1 family)
MSPDARTRGTEWLRIRWAGDDNMVPCPPMRGVPAPWSCVTLDVHEVDRPEDIGFAAGWLVARRIPATFFVPGLLWRQARFRDALATLPGLGHEVASHGLRHDWAEAAALSSGRGLGFLAAARDLHEQALGVRPVSFRAPYWGRLAPGAAAELARLGYEVDSSATPQRLPLLSSRPFARGWLFASRRPRPLAPGLLEIPTSTLLVPAWGSTFPILRGASRAFLGLLAAEARWMGDRVLVVQIHAGDLDPDAPATAEPRRAGWGDLLPRRTGGVGLRWWMHERDPRRRAVLHQQLVGRLAADRCACLRDVGRALRAVPGGGPDLIPGDRARNMGP